MLFMVIERFKVEAKAIGKRFTRQGRMMPEGMVYHASWVDTSGTRCYQLMEAPREELLKTWINHWDDLVEFEIVPVVNSSDFWAKVPAE